MQVGKQYYSMAEVRKQTGLPDSTLRYWETQFEELSPRKDGHGNRYYTEADIAFLQRVRFIRDEMKITRIEAIRRELQSDSKKSDAKARAVRILGRVRDELAEIRSLL